MNSDIETNKSSRCAREQPNSASTSRRPKLDLPLWRSFWRAKWQSPTRVAQYNRVHNFPRTPSPGTIPGDAPSLRAWAVHGQCGVNSRTIMSLFLFTMGREKRGLRLAMSEGVASEVSARIYGVYATPICVGNIHCFELSILIDKTLQDSIHHDVLTDDPPPGC
jgi:hypothetical protein